MAEQERWDQGLWVTCMSENIARVTRVRSRVNNTTITWTSLSNLHTSTKKLVQFLQYHTVMHWLDTFSSELSVFAARCVQSTSRGVEPETIAREESQDTAQERV